MEKTKSMAEAEELMEQSSGTNLMHKWNGRDQDEVFLGRGGEGRGGGITKHL